MRKLIIVIYVIAFFMLLAGVISIPQDDWAFMSTGETLALGFSLLAGFSGILLSYYAYVDGNILASIKTESEHDERKEHKDIQPEHGMAFTMAHVKVDQLDRLQYGELKSRSRSNKKRMMKDIVFEARTLTKQEYLETTSANELADDTLKKLAKKLGSDFRVTRGSNSGKGSVLYIKRDG